jgi:hypothetical protein
LNTDTSNVTLVYTLYEYFEIFALLIGVGEPDSSVSIVSGYGLDDRAIEVRSPTEAKRFSPPVSVSRPALGPPSLLYNGYWGSFPRG